MKSGIVIVFLISVIQAITLGERNSLGFANVFDIGYVNDAFSLTAELKEGASSEKEYHYKCVTKNAPCLKFGIDLESTEDLWMNLRAEFLYMFPTEIDFSPVNGAPRNELFEDNRVQSFQLSGNYMFRIPLVPRISPIRFIANVGAGAGLGLFDFTEKMLDEFTVFVNIYPVAGGELLLFNRVSMVNEYSYHWGVSFAQDDRHDVGSSTVKRGLLFYMRSFRTFYGLNMYF